jgi:hypothetical protein
MATITSAQSGDFSDPATWVGGVVPGVGDVAVAATGHVIVIDVDVTVDQVTTTGGTFTLTDGVTLTATNATAGVLGAATGIGAVTMDLNAPDSATIVGNVRGGGIASSWGVQFTGTGSLTINGQVTGGTFAGADATGASAVQLTGAGTLTVDNGTDTAVQGGSATFARGILCTAAATIAVIGNIITTVNTGYGIQNSGQATIIITGNLAGGNANGTQTVFNTGVASITIQGNISGANPFSNSAASTIDITGNIAAFGAGGGLGFANSGAATIVLNGNITGGGSNGLNNTAASTITITGNITGGAAAGLSNTNASAVIELNGTLQASATQPAVLSNNTASITVSGPLITSSTAQTTASASGLFPIISQRWYVKESAIETFFIEMRSSDIVGEIRPSRTLFVAEGVTSGASALPLPTDVRAGVIYAVNNALTGTCAVPPPTAVASGVPVDATTGEAVIRQADAAAIFGAIWEQG